MPWSDTRRVEAADSQSDVAVVAVYDLSRISRGGRGAAAFPPPVRQRPWITVRFADGMPFGVSAVEKARFGTTSIFAELQRDQTVSIDIVPAPS